MSGHPSDYLFTLSDQVFHEPVGDAKLRLCPCIEQRRRQSRGLQIQIDDQNPFTAARQAPRENRGGSAPTHSALDGKESVTTRTAFR